MTCYCDDAPPIGTSLSSEDKRQHRYSHLLDHDRCSARWNANKWDAVPDNYDPNCSCCRDSQREAKSSNKPTPPKSYDGYCTVGMTEKTQDTPDGGWELVYEQGCKCKAFTPKQLQYDACNCGHHIRNHEFRTEQQIADFAWEQENL